MYVNAMEIEICLMFLDPQFCPVCDKDTPECEICSQFGCTGDNKCQGAVCYFERCCGQGRITKAGCNLCDGRPDMEASCTPDCHCSLCCLHCDPANVTAALENACGK